MREKYKGIEVNNLSLALNNKLIIENSSFAVESGGLCVLLGANGAGKTSLLKALAGFLQPAKGDIRLWGKNITSLTRKNLAQIVSYVPQNHQLVYDCSVLDFVVTGRTPYLSVFSTPKRQDKILAFQALEILGIEKLAERSYLKLSGGERQMVLLARSLTQETKIMLLDEPTTFLDYSNQHLLMETLQTLLRRKKITVLVTLHDPNLALEYADQIIVIGENQILADLNKKEESFIIKIEEVMQRLYGAEVRIKKYDDRLLVLREREQENVMSRVV